MPPPDTPTPTPPPVPPEQLYLDNLELIEKIAATVARHHHASAEEAEEFVADFRFKLLDNDYAVLDQFEGTSTLKTYLTAVAVHAFLDSRDRRWGKWRSSAAAKKLGEVAVQLEELIDRDGWSFDEAYRLLRTNHQVAESEQQLLEIYKQLPGKTSRRMEDEGELEDHPTTDQGPEDQVLDRELRETRRRVSEALHKVLHELSTDDRMIVQLRVFKDIKIVAIARVLGTPQKPLYGRIKNIYTGLKSALQREGVGWEQVSDLLNRPDPSGGLLGRPRHRPKEN